jgi:transcriptional regulator of heat shock response
MMTKSREICLSARQEEILDGIVREYIKLAQPISSQLLEKRRNFGVCPATIRNEMQKLTEKGYLCQPHPSAGRVPTDKGYRFFVNKLLKKDLEVSWERKDVEDLLDEVRDLTRLLAEKSSNLALGYLSAERVLWKEGWEEIFHEPEFSQAGLALRLAQLVNDLEENIEKIKFFPEIQIYIGRENPVSRVQDFSMVTLGFGQGLFALLGPKRMNYDKNIALFYSLCREI